MIIFAVILALILLVVELISLKIPIEDIKYNIKFSQSYVEPDETFEIISNISNTRWIPISFLRVRETLPDGIFVNIENSNSDFKHSFQPSTAGLPASIGCKLFLMPKRSVMLRVSATMPKRGRYFCGDTTLFVGDFFGVREIHDKRLLNRELVVLPRKAEDLNLEVTLGGFMGDISVKRFIIEDPILTLGFREYTGREPMRSISWVQSAHRNSLMVKNYDHTAEPSVCILLNTECTGNTISFMEDTIERCFSIARTVCETLDARGIQYGFATNATVAGATGSWSVISDGLGRTHLETILTGLGRATYAHTVPFSVLLKRSFLSAGTARAYIIITPEISAEYEHDIARLRESSGQNVLIINAFKEAS